MMPTVPRTNRERRVAGTQGLITILMAISMLGIIAAAAAMWSDSLKIQATVKTGDVDISFDGQPVASDNESLYTPPVDIGKCFAEFKQIQNEEEVVNNKYPQYGSSAGNDDLELNITVVNAYPSYYCKVDNVFVRNTGSVPVKILVKFVLPPGASCTYNPISGHFDCDMDGDGDLDLDIWGSFQTLNTSQIDPGGYRTFTVELHVKQGAPENSTISLELLFIGIQWNEFPS